MLAGPASARALPVAMKRPLPTLEPSEITCNDHEVVSQVSNHKKRMSWRDFLHELVLV
jgi:hypothetical protein